jgi:dolichol-phosphate mannosyltransferase
MPKLSIIMPVYNEEGAIEHVVQKWVDEFRKTDTDFIFHIYNDGSKDNSGSLLDELAATYPEVQVYHQENMGHGPTILKGYRENRQAEWLFQIDSDDELGTAGFAALWAARHDHDFLIGFRQDRQAPFARALITKVTALTVGLLYGSGIRDVNCPFRLMRGAAFRELYQRIPADTFAPNVIISGFAAQRRLRIFQVPIIHQFRRTGEVSIKHWKLLRAAIQSFGQTITFRMKRWP